MQKILKIKKKRFFLFFWGGGVPHQPPPPPPPTIAAFDLTAADLVVVMSLMNSLKLAILFHYKS